MEIRRIVPDIISNKFEESKKFYQNFLGLKLAMDMEWIITFVSKDNPTAQINIVQSDKNLELNSNIAISIEVTELENLYKKAQLLNYEITYPMTEEPWGVKRFFVKDPNGVIVNMMRHISNDEN